MSEDAIYISEYLENKSEKAASEIVRKYQKFVYLTVLRLVENSDEAKDITQEVFIKALNSLAKFRGDSSLKTWLYKIAVNNATNYLRKKKLKQFLSLSNGEEWNELPANAPTPEQDLHYAELQSDFLKALSKLPYKQRETFVLRYFENLSYNEISEILGVAVGTLKANYFYAIKKLAEELKKYGE